MSSSDRLEALAHQIEHAQRPPLHLWHPEREASIDITIRRDGSWIHEGGEIKREALVKLFASILRLEEGRYFLVTPVEKLEIIVEDSPFLATSMETFHTGSEEQLITFHTNLGDPVIVDDKHALSVSYSNSGEPAPHVEVRDGLRALLARSVWIELAELATECRGVTGVFSSGMFFALSA